MTPTTGADLAFDGLVRHALDDRSWVEVGPGWLQHIRTVLSERYAVDFDSMLVNFYRDGRDSVAWHGDTVHHRLREPRTTGSTRCRRFAPPAHG